MGQTLYSYESKINAPAADVFRYHQRAAVFQRLLPPWESVKIVDRKGSIENGDTVTIKVPLGPFSTTWIARHEEFLQDSQFADVQVKGLFKSWKHVHSVRKLSPDETSLIETIEFELPFGQIGHQLSYGKIREKLNRLFTYRHAITENDLQHWLQFKPSPKYRVAITGGNGLIGSELAVFLASQGHEVKILSRSGHSKIYGIAGVRWDPANGFIDSTSLGEVDCFIHLAGENIAAGRWTENRMKKLRESRVQVTRFLTNYILNMENPPEVFISASGTGFYGSHLGNASELTPKGSGFLADLCSEWEYASMALENSGIRRVIVRTGLVLSSKGGALRKMLPVFRMGLGGPVGKGTHYWSWIAMDDLLRIYDTLVQNPDMHGIYNAVSAEPVLNRDFSRILGATLGRPAIIPAPEFALKAALGDMAEDALLANQCVLPSRLIDSGFRFDFPDLDLALTHCLGRY